MKTILFKFWILTVIELILVCVTPYFAHAWTDTDSFGYTGTDAVSISWEDYSRWTSIRLADEEIVDRIPIGFTFYFYGSPYTEVTISSNGWIGFDSYSDPYLEDEPMPGTAIPNNFIGPLWDNLEPDLPDAGVYYSTWGTPPAQVFGVTWAKCPKYSNQGSVTVQVLLYEGSNDIKFQYLEIIHYQNDGRWSTTGIENQTGTVGLQYNHQVSGTIYDGLAILISLHGMTPTPTPTITPTGTPARIPAAQNGGIILLFITLGLIAFLRKNV
jgi:hypothetical protein